MTTAKRDAIVRSLVLLCLLVTSILARSHPLSFSSTPENIPLIGLELLGMFPLVQVLDNQTCPNMSENEFSGALVHVHDRPGEQNNWLMWLCLSTSALVSSFMEWYSKSLDTNPVITKSVTSGLIGAFGDILAQIFEAWTVGKAFRCKDIQMRRLFSLVAEGLFVSGPLMHFAYDILEEQLPIFAENQEDHADAMNSWIMAICQVLVDAVVMDSLFIATMIITSALLEGRGRELKQEMMDTYMPAVKVSMVSSIGFAPIQCISFKYISLNYRVAAINVQDIAWNAAMSYMAHRSMHTDDASRSANTTHSTASGAISR